MEWLLLVNGHEYAGFLPSLVIFQHYSLVFSANTQTLIKTTTNNNCGSSSWRNIVTEMRFWAASRFAECAKKQIINNCLQQWF